MRINSFHIYFFSVNWVGNIKLLKLSTFEVRKFVNKKKFYEKFINRPFVFTIVCGDFCRMICDFVRRSVKSEESSSSRRERLWNFVIAFDSSFIANLWLSFFLKNFKESIWILLPNFLKKFINPVLSQNLQ